MKRRWKPLPTRWKRRAGAARTLPRCWESATKPCFTRCGSSIWIRRGRGSRRQGPKKLQPWGRGTVSDPHRGKIWANREEKQQNQERHILRRDFCVILSSQNPKRTLNQSEGNWFEFQAGGSGALASQA